MCLWNDPIIFNFFNLISSDPNKAKEEILIQEKEEPKKEIKEKKTRRKKKLDQNEEIRIEAVE